VTAQAIQPLTCNVPEQAARFTAVAGASRPVTRCRLCGSGNLVRYLDLGPQPPSDAFRTDPGQAQVYYPLEVLLCEACKLSQLSQLVDPRLLYQQDYPYEASTTATGRAHFTALAQTVVARYGLTAADYAVDIGSNVGVLVEAFCKAGIRAFGVEPAPNIAALAKAHGVPTFNDWWDTSMAKWLATHHGPAAVISATNVFAHQHEPERFLEAVDSLLAPQGVLVIEAPWFLRLVQGLEYDTIYHEHVFYLTLGSLVPWFARHGYAVLDAVPTGIHGGSLRVFVGRHGQHPIARSVGQALAEERLAGLHDYATLRGFARRVAAHRPALLQRLYALKRQGHRLAGIGAPAKGSTLLNYCGIGPDLLEFVTDKSPLKIGKYTPGLGLPVKADAALERDGITRGLVLAWNFAPEILRNLAPWQATGGRALLPLPTPRLARGAA
jgi:SAM-dependent methyltransferase